MRRNSSGFLTIEIIGAIFIATLLTLGLMQWQDSALEDMRGQQAAQHHKQVVDAALKYIKDNHATITATATAAVPVRVTVAMLQAAPGRYLDAAFSPNNSFGQTACVLVLQPVANKISALVVTENGKAIADKDIHYVASLTGKGAGAVSSTAPTLSQGAYGSFSVPLAPFNSQNCSGTAVNAGHLANYLYFDGEGDLLADYLYRDAVPGHPEANTMNTPLIMASVQTSGAACTTTGSIARDSNGAVLSCQGGTWKGGSGGLTWKGTVANFASLPASGNSSGDAYRISGLSNHVFVWDAQNSVWQGLVVDSSGNLSLPGLIYTAGSNSSYGAITMQGSKNGWSGINFKDSSGSNAGTLMMSPSYSGFFNAADGAWRWYVDNSGNSYQPGNVEAGTLQVDTAVVEGSACSPDGKIAKSSSTSGLILSCQSGVWTGQGAGLGIGQTWKNVSGSRSAGVPYKNITGQPIAVSLNLGQGSSYSGGGMYVDGVLVNYCWSGFSSINNCTVVVPDQSTYYLFGNSTPVNLWVELRR